MNVKIIAEAGVNHDGDFSKAIELIDIASASGADFVKFQSFTASQLVTKTTEKAGYQNSSVPHVDTQYSLLKELELSRTQMEALAEHAGQRNIGFISAPFDIPNIDFLCDLGVPFLKIPSGEITNVPYMRHIAQTGKPLVMSTGMAYLHEVIEAAETLFGAGLQKENLTVLHCNTEYPSPMDDVNLRAMITIKNELGVSVGYSDHTLGIEVSLAAVALGATVIEKHFTLDPSSDGPDHKASLSPQELAQLVQSIRNIESALGSTVKAPSNSEKKNIDVVRKKIVAAMKIKKGDRFSKENITTKRSNNGASATFWDHVLGQEALRDYDVNESIEYVEK